MEKLWRKTRTRPTDNPGAGAASSDARERGCVPDALACLFGDGFGSDLFGGLVSLVKALFAGVDFGEIVALGKTIIGAVKG